MARVFPIKIMLTNNPFYFFFALIIYAYLIILYIFRYK